MQGDDVFNSKVLRPDGVYEPGYRRKVVTRDGLRTLMGQMEHAALDFATTKSYDAFRKAQALTQEYMEAWRDYVMHTAPSYPPRYFSEKSQPKMPPIVRPR